MSALPEHYITIDEYFALEETGKEKHEYYDGKIFAMTGGHQRHNLISMNASGNLYMQLRGKSCTVYPSDMRVKVEATKLYTYPDVSVICGPPKFADGRHDTLSNPTVIIEVLSPSTEGYDRWQKTRHYRTIETLQEYLLIAQDSMHVELYRRHGKHRWLLVEFTGEDAVIPLASIDCELEMRAIYEKVDFTEG